MRQYEWELFGARDATTTKLPFLGWVVTETLSPQEACKEARQANPGAAFVKLADGQGRKVIFLNIDEVFADAESR